METSIVVASFVILAIQIWLIILFVLTYSNIKKIKELISFDLNKQASLSVDLLSVKKAILLGNEEKIYNLIINNLCDSFYKTLKNQTSIDNIPGEVVKDLKQTIDRAKKYCLLLNKPFPDQLASIDNFKNFYNS